MKRSVFTAFLLPFLASLGIAQPPPASRSVVLRDLAGTIQTELESHGERMLGQETYRWSTRLDRIANCRAELSVRVVSNLGESTVRTESVNFSLGAVEPYNIVLKKNWLELPCVSGQKCIFSTSTCSRKSKDAIVTDCTTASQKRVESFSLQLDGDADAATRLEQAFRQAVALCREPKIISF